MSSSARHLLPWLLILLQLGSACAHAASPSKLDPKIFDARAEAIEREWRPTDKEALRYFAAVNSLVHEASAAGLALNERMVAVADRALAKPIESVVTRDRAALHDVQIEIATWLLTTAPEVSSGPEFSELRRAVARSSLRYLRSLDSRLRAIATDKRPVLNVTPPVATGPVFAGMAPAAIKDPEARRAYEDAIKANAELAARVREQDRLRTHSSLVHSLLERFIEVRYAQPPANTAERTQWLAELDTLK